MPEPGTQHHFILSQLELQPDDQWLTLARREVVTSTTSQVVANVEEVGKTLIELVKVRFSSLRFFQDFIDNIVSKAKYPKVWFELLKHQ